MNQHQRQFEQLPSAEQVQVPNNLRETYQRVSVMHHFNKAVREQRLDYTNSQQIARCFKALHASQRSAACFCAAGEAPFAEALAHYQTRVLGPEEQGPHLNAQETSFSLARFKDLENVILDIETREKGKHLHAFWTQIINNGLVVGGLNPPRTAYEKSLWLRDVNNAPAIALCTYLSLHNLQAIPDEIQALKIRYLRIEGWEGSCLSTLPEVFGDQSELVTLELIGHNFRAVPRALAGLGRLARFIYNKQAGTQRISRRSCAQAIWRLYGACA